MTFVVGRFRHPHYNDGEVTQMVEDGLLEPDGSARSLDAIEDAGLDAPDVQAPTCYLCPCGIGETPCPDEFGQLACVGEAA